MFNKQAGRLLRPINTVKQLREELYAIFNAEDIDSLGTINLIANGKAPLVFSGLGEDIPFLDLGPLGRLRIHNGELQLQQPDGTVPRQQRPSSSGGEQYPGVVGSKSGPNTYSCTIYTVGLSGTPRVVDVVERSAAEEFIIPTQTAVTVFRTNDQTEYFMSNPSTWEVYDGTVVGGTGPTYSMSIKPFGTTGDAQIVTVTQLQADASYSHPAGSRVLVVKGLDGTYFMQFPVWVQ